MRTISEAPVTARLPEAVNSFPTAPRYTSASQDRLRITSKGLEKSLMGWFMKKFERGCGKTTGLFEILMTAKDIQALHTASKSSKIRETITSLHINVGHFSTEPEEMSLMMHPPAWSEVDEYKDAFLTGDSVKLLSQAFSNLPNLHEVYIGKGRMPFHVLGGKKYAMDHCAWFEGPEALNDMRTPGAGHVLRTGVVKSVLEALALSGHCVEKLVIQSSSTMTRGQEAGILSFDLPEPILTELATSFQNLTKFHLTMSFEKDEHPDTMPAGSTEDERLQLLVRFLTTASSMESFHLAASRGSIFSPDFIQAVRNALPTSLKEFHLYNSMLTAAVLHRVLDLHHLKVTELGLYSCFLVDESWKLFSRTLDMYKSRLKHVYLEELWELRHELQGDRGLPDGWKEYSARRIFHDDSNMCTVGDDGNTCPVTDCIDSYRKSDFRDNSMFMQEGYVRVGDLNLKVHSVNFGVEGIDSGILCTWMQRRWWSVIGKDFGPYLRDWYEARCRLKEHEGLAEE